MAPQKKKQNKTTLNILFYLYFNVYNYFVFDPNPAQLSKLCLVNTQTQRKTNPSRCLCYAQWAIFVKDFCDVHTLLLTFSSLFIY